MKVGDKHRPESRLKISIATARRHHRRRDAEAEVLAAALQKVVVAESKPDVVGTLASTAPEAE
jgi:hypothetical protein